MIAEPRLRRVWVTIDEVTAVDPPSEDERETLRAQNVREGFAPEEGLDSRAIVATVALHAEFSDGTVVQASPESDPVDVHVSDFFFTDADPADVLVIAVARTFAHENPWLWDPFYDAVNRLGLKVEPNRRALTGKGQVEASPETLEAVRRIVGSWPPRASER